MAKDKDKTQPQRGASTKASRTEQRQKEREREQRRQRITVTAIIAVIVIVLGAAVLIASNTPADAPIPASAERYDKLPQALQQVTNEKGYPRIGSLDGIPVSLFTSLGCDDCNTFHKDVLPQLVDRVEAGDISLTYVPLRGGTLVNFNGATRSALCAARQNKFFQYVDAAVHWQDQYGSGAFSDNRLQTGATNLSLDKGQFDSCRSSAPEGTVFQNALTDLGGRAAEVRLPSVLVNNILVVDGEGIPSNNIDDINAAIDAAIDFRTGGGTPTPEPTDEPTDAATAEPAETTEPTIEAPTAEPTAEPTAVPATATTEPATDVPVDATAAPTETAAP